MPRVERIWEADGVVATALAPLAWLFGAGVRARNALYDAGVLASQPLGLPTVSVGNLTVGGTGKTPMSAWVAAWLAARDARPGILLRGYGDDEPLVHRHLTPAAVVVPDADRVAGARRARLAGADVLVLDDGFQHRRARRDVDLVLVAAEQGAARRLLPAGPLREGRRALGRADALIVTRKRASYAEADAVAAAWSTGHAGLPTVLVRFAAGPLRAVPATPGTDSPPPSLTGARVLAISAIGDPRSFEEQLRAMGARVESAAFGDHHPFRDADIDGLVARARAADVALCTLKDAVKLQGRWPRQAPPLWYLSQVVIVERGEQVLEDLLGRLIPTAATS